MVKHHGKINFIRCGLGEGGLIFKNLLQWLLSVKKEK
jgi:hypothetical protein